MPDFLHCPACGTKAADNRSEFNRPARCEKCGAVLTSTPGDWNPYDAPSAPLGKGEEGSSAALDIPPTVFGKFGLAFRLLGNNLTLFAFITLTVWLPANTVIAHLGSNIAEERQMSVSIQMNNFAEGIFGPISLGALIFAVAKRIEGEEVGYFEAIGVGFQNWGRLFVARFIAGLIILLGFIALIVPGIIISVRYALLAPVVILERATPPRQRSTALTAGKRWKIVGASLVYFSLLAAFSLAVNFGIAILQEEVEWLNSLWVTVAIGCLEQIVECLYTIVIVLFYLEARGRESAEVVYPDDDEMFFSKKMTEPL